MLRPVHFRRKAVKEQMFLFFAKFLGVIESFVARLSISLNVGYFQLIEGLTNVESAEEALYVCPRVVTGQYAQGPPRDADPGGVAVSAASAPFP